MTARSALFWLAAACCIFAEVAILKSLLFGRARKAEEQRAREAGPGIRATRPAEIVWAVLPAAGLLLVLYLTWRAVDLPAAPAEVSHVGATIGA